VTFLIGSAVIIGLGIVYLAVLDIYLRVQKRRDARATRSRRLPGAFRDR
jgi:archaellum component FlaF (FlaF/FlaG flagellin family)